MRNTPPSSPRRRRTARGTLRAASLSVVLVAAAVACSDTTEGAAPEDPATTSAPTTTVAATRPAGPAADLSTVIEGTDVFIGASTVSDLAAVGYVEEERVATGEAAAYVADGPLPGDGRWTLRAGDAALYRTRVLVRRPAEAADASGTVIVEWLNVSGGVDANPEWAALEEEIVRQGHVWVGVSAQRIGVEGGPVLVPAPGAEGVAGRGLKALRPERYGDLTHPGDGHAFDIFTQVARAVREGGDLLGGIRPTHLIAAGESQSAIALVTYHDGVQPLTDAFDAFFVHSRASVALPLVGPGEYADLAGAIGREPVLFRTDLDAPVLVLQAEGDVDGVLTSVAARQPDGERLRLWEVAGTAHADRHLLGPLADSTGCGVDINDGPLHVVAKAALRHLDTWMRGGVAPPSLERLEVTGGPTPTVRRDGDGIALGGVRTPPVDVPVEVLSGVPGPTGGVICKLLGSTTPLSATRLAQRYADRGTYEEAYAAAVDAAIATGVVLDDDREAIEAFARPDRLPGS